MRKYIFIYICLLPLFCFSQKFANKKYYLVDSLNTSQLTESDKILLESSLKQFHNNKTDTGKINALNTICENMIDQSWVKYQFFQYDLIQLAQFKYADNKKVLKKLKYDLANALNNIGFFYANTGKANLALKYYNESLKARPYSNSKDDQIHLSSTYNNMGLVLTETANFEEALKYHHKSLKLRESIDYKFGIANSFNNIGLIYAEQKNYEVALDYYNKSLNIHTSIKNKTGMAGAHHNIAASFDDLKKYDEAIENYQQCLKYQTDLGDKMNMALTLSNLGVCYYNIGKKDIALDYYYKSINLHKETGNRSGYVRAAGNIARRLLELNRINEADKLITETLEIAQEIGFPEGIASISGVAHEIAQTKQDWKQALNMFKLNVKMNDSLSNQKAQKIAIKKHAQYEYEKQKAVDDAEHEKEMAIEKEAAAKQTILTYATAGGLGLVAIFLLIVFNRLKVTRKQKNIIEEQKQEVENQKAVVEEAHTELEEKNKEITDSIQYAKRIQNAILPPNKIVKEYLQESFIYYKPKDIVAGDFYWMEAVNDKVLFAAADCTGHGVPGAMVSVVCNNGLNRSVREYGLIDPGEILNKTREIVVQEFEKSEEDVKDGMDIALCSLEGNTLQYAGAHNPLWLIRDGELLETKANKQPIGQFDNPKPYTTHTIELQKGDSLYIFSDGYADQFGGEKGKKLKTANFKKLLLSIQNEPMHKQKELINEAFENWKGKLEQLDDVCVIGVQF